MKRIFIILGLLISTGVYVDPTQACGPETNCMIGDGRHYRIKMPDSHDGATKIGAIVYAHGYRGSANGMMRNKSMTRLASNMGVALIATKSFGEDWHIPGRPRDNNNDGSVEFEYYDAVVKDVVQRFPIDENAMMATGFSAGGMMVWNLICHRSELFAGFAPISGTFWTPEPTTCTSPPTNVVHIHGDDDPVVPLTGRPIADTHQGRVPQVLDMYANYGNYEPAGASTVGKLSCQNRKNADNQILDFCQFSGGHSFRSEYVRQAWEILKIGG